MGTNQETLYVYVQTFDWYCMFSDHMQYISSVSTADLVRPWSPGRRGVSIAFRTAAALTIVQNNPLTLCGFSFVHV